MSDRFNFTEIEKFTGRDPFALKDMIGIFLKSVPETLSEINKAYKENDHEQFRYYSHKLKSSIDLLSIWELKAEIRLLENCSESDFHSPKIGKLIRTLNTTLDELLPEIEKEVS